MTARAAQRSGQRRRSGTRSARRRGGWANAPTSRMPGQRRPDYIRGRGWRQRFGTPVDGGRATACCQPASRRNRKHTKRVRRVVRASQPPRARFCAVYSLLSLPAPHVGSPRVHHPHREAPGTVSLNPDHHANCKARSVSRAARQLARVAKTQQRRLWEGPAHRDASLVREG